MAPLATVQVEAPAESVVEAHETHADQVLLQSVARMTVYAQHQQHLHAASVPQVVGTSPVEAAHVMHNMYTSGLWHLVDNVRIHQAYCFICVLSNFTYFDHISFLPGHAVLCAAPSGFLRRWRNHHK